MLYFAAKEKGHYIKYSKLPTSDFLEQVICYTERYVYICLRKTCHDLEDEYYCQQEHCYRCFDRTQINMEDIKQSKIYRVDYHENNGEYYMLMINTFPLCSGIFGAIGGSNPNDESRYCFACPFSVSYHLQFSHLFNLQKRTGVCKCEVFYTHSDFV